MIYETSLNPATVLRQSLVTSLLRGLEGFRNPGGTAIRSGVGTVALCTLGRCGTWGNERLEVGDRVRFQ